MVTDNTKAVLAALRAATGRGVRKTGRQVVEGMREEMLAPKSGIVYGAHQASAPGESPANETGKLLGTLKMVETGDVSVEVRGGGPEAPYLAEDLEWGTPGGKVAPRPLFVPAADRAAPLLLENVMDEIESVL